MSNIIYPIISNEGIARMYLKDWLEKWIRVNMKRARWLRGWD